MRTEASHYKYVEEVNSRLWDDKKQLVYDNL